MSACPEICIVASQDVLAGIGHGDTVAHVSAHAFVAAATATLSCSLHAAATHEQLSTMQPSDLTDTVWALARLRYTPPKPWTQTLTSAITTSLPGFSAQGLAMVIWGFTRLGLRPERQWLLRFKSASGMEFQEEGAQQLAQFVAGLLAQQNRQRFSAQQGRRQQNSRG
jgi:hypothetical protein